MESRQNETATIDASMGFLLNVSNSRSTLHVSFNLNVKSTLPMHLPFVVLYHRLGFGRWPGRSESRVDRPHALVGERV